MAEDDMGHMAHLTTVQNADLRQIQDKEATYQGSWKRRGGIGAFMMLARKWDRIEGMLKRHWGYDLLAAMVRDGRSESGATEPGDDGTILAEVRDLRTYLTLVEAEVLNMREKTHAAVRGLRAEADSIKAEAERRYTQTGQEKWAPGTPEDGGQHAARYYADGPRHPGALLKKVFCDCPQQRVGSSETPACPQGTTGHRCVMWVTRAHTEEGW